MCHFFKVPLFSNGIKACFFWWVPLLLGLCDGAVFVFLKVAMCIRNILLGSQTVIIYCFYSSLN